MNVKYINLFFICLSVWVVGFFIGIGIAYFIVGLIRGY
jgi:hypothetical protein